MQRYSSLPRGTESAADLNGWAGRNSEFILRKKEDSSKQTSPIADPKRNEPYALTSLFNRDLEPSDRPEFELPHSIGDESTSQDRKSDVVGNFPFTVSYPVIYPSKETEDKKHESFSEVPNPPKMIDDGPERPATPEYDAHSILGEDPSHRDAPITNGNKLSLAVAEELKQRFQSRESNYGNEDSSVDPFGFPSEQVLFNPMSSAAATSSIRTRRLVPGSYGKIPPAPPLPLT